MKPFTFILIVILILQLAGAVEVAPSRQEAASYDAVQTIFDDNCVMCHAGAKPPKGLRLDGYENLMRGSDRGTVVETGNPDASELMKRIRGTSTPRMPLSGPPWLDDAEMRLIEEWIRSGAPAGAQRTIGNEPSPLPPAKREHVTYADVAPIFKASCVKCHNHKGLVGPPPEGLVLASYHEIMNGTERAYVVPGKPDASEIVRKIRGQSRPRMPLDGPPYLTGEEIALVERWVAEGAKDESGTEAEIPVGRKVRLGGTLTSPGSLDGMRLNIGGRVDIKKLERSGGYVEVRGVVTENGAIRVERVRGRRPSDRHDHPEGVEHD